MSQTSLAEFFNKQRELIEAAETPFAKLAIFILPILAPMVPAILTGMHLYQLFLQLFDFSGYRAFAALASLLPAIVLEMLGYVGAISSIQALFKWIGERGSSDGEKFLVPAVLNFLAYIFYLTAMYLINVSLGEYFGTPKIVNTIIGLLAFITVPTSLLAANHLAMREHDDTRKEIRQEKREDKLRAKMIESGMNPFLTQYQSSIPQAPQIKEDGEPSRKFWGSLSVEQKREAKYVLSVEELMKKYKISRATAYNWKSKTDV